MIMRALRSHNVANVVVVAQDGAEALDYFFGCGGEQRPLPQLVLLDLRLPKIDGLEVLTALRANSRTALLPVVVLTTSQEERDLIDSYRHGANS
ncbi:MAG: response regulator, partial [Armatimonadota bacterium]